MFRAGFCASLITGLRWAFRFVECVCLSFCESSDWDWIKYTRCDRLLLVNPFYLFLMLLLLLLMMMSSSLENYFGFRTSVRVKADDFVSLSWNVKNVLNKEVCIFLIIMPSICELISCPVLRLLSPRWIKTRLYSVISSYGYFFYMHRFIYLCRTSFILVFSQRTSLLTHASEQTCALKTFAEL